MSVFNEPPLDFVPQPFHESNSPRMLVYLPDAGTFRVLEYELTLAIHGAADTAQVVIPNRGAPDWSVVLERSQQRGNANVPVYINIYSGLLPDGQTPTLSNLKLRFAGVVDRYEVDDGPPNDWTTFFCRSMAAPLVDTKIVVPLSQNKTTAAFIQDMATRFNMPAPEINLVQAPVTMQQVLAQELLAGVHSYSIWEMMVRASLADDVDLRVDPKGKIHYLSRTRPGRVNCTMRHGRDIADGMKLMHSPQFSKNVQVDVKIVNPQTRTSTITRAFLSDDGTSLNLMSGTRTVTSQKIFGTLDTVTHSISQPYSEMGGGIELPKTASTTFTTTDPNSGAFNASAGQGHIAGDSGRERYVVWLKGSITKEAALAEARRRWLEISQHEYTVEMRVPVSKRLFDQFDIGSNIIIQGLRYRKFNGQYWPREVTEHCSVDSGFFWTIKAINHAPPQGVTG